MLTAPSKMPLATLEPNFPHSQQWLDSRTLKIQPLTRLAKARQFRVKINTSATAIDGSRLAQPFSFSFHTPRLHLLNAVREQIKANGQITLCLEFDDRVHPQNLRRHLKLLDPSDRCLDFTCADTSARHPATYRFALKLLATSQKSDCAWPQSLMGKVVS